MTNAFRAVIVRSVPVVPLVISQALASPPCLRPAPDSAHPLFGALAFRTESDIIGDPDFTIAVTGALGDLNHDGHADAVVGANSILTVLMGRGGGLFGPPVPYEAGEREQFVAMVDLNLDGRLDVLVCNDEDETVAILLGLGDGTLGEASAYPVGERPRSAVSADFNLDGAPDVAVLNIRTSDVSILLNAGDGTLLPEVRIPVSGVTPLGNPNGRFPHPGPFIAAGDLDADGRVDLVIPARSRAHILLGDGLGGFVEAGAHAQSPTNNVYNIALADLDGNGSLDIASAIAAQGVSRMIVWRNDGSGAFPVAEEYDSSWRGVGPLYNNPGLAIADFTGDGHPDIAVASERFLGIPLHANRGDGTFADAEILPTFEQSWFIARTDANADGHADLAIVSFSLRGMLRVRLNDGEGELSTPHPRRWRTPCLSRDMRVSNTTAATVSIRRLSMDSLFTRACSKEWNFSLAIRAAYSRSWSESRSTLTVIQQQAISDVHLLSNVEPTFWPAIPLRRSAGSNPGESGRFVLPLGTTSNPRSFIRSMTASPPDLPAPTSTTTATTSMSSIITTC